MDSPQASPLLLGPFVGIDEVSASPNHVASALNIDFTPEGARRRPPRVKLAAFVGLEEPPAAVRGLFVWRRLDGTRQLVARFESEGSGVVLAIIDDFGAVTEIAQSEWYDRWETGQNTVIGPSWADWREVCEGVSINGHLVIATASGRLLDFDGTTVKPLQAMNGADAEAGNTAALTYLTSPPLAKSMTVWRNRLVAAGDVEIGLSCEDDPALVPDAAPIGGPNCWPSQSHFSIIDPEGDEISTVLVHLDRLVVLGVRSVHIVDEDGAQPVARCVDRTRGCIAPGSAQNAGNGIIYLSHGAVVEFDGSSVTEISGKIAKTLKRINWLDARNAVSVHVRQKHEYRLWVPRAGRSGNTLCLIFNYEKREWKIYAIDYGLAFDLETNPAGVTCACSLVNEDGIEVVYTGDAYGNVWREDVEECSSDTGGENPSEGIVAFLSTYLTPGHSNLADFADVHVEAAQDGSLLGAQLLDEGQQESEALYGYFAVANYADVPPTQTLPDDPAGVTWGDIPNPYPVRNQRFQYVRLPLALTARSSRLMLLLPPLDVGAAIVPARGCIRRIELKAVEQAARTA